jgi:hypothetical protein
MRNPEQENSILAFSNKLEEFYRSHIDNQNVSTLNAELRNIKVVPVNKNSSCVAGINEPLLEVRRGLRS